MSDFWEDDVKAHKLIEQTAAKYGVDPNLFKAVAKTESNFNPKAVSPKGAQGVMQLMPDTAKKMGVKNPLDPAQSIEGGGKLLGQLTAKYKGDPDKIAAAYNAGEPAVDKHGGIPPIPETQDYVKKVRAASEPSFWEEDVAKNNRFGDPEKLRLQNEMNKSAGRLTDIAGGINTAAEAIRGGAPALAAAFPEFSPIILGGGEAAAQALEKTTGAREALNPYTIGTAAALGAIPLPDFAKRLAARTPIPKVAYPLFKAPEGYAQGAAFTLAQHGIGKATAGLPGTEGEEPTWSGGEMNTAGMAGGAIATLGALARIHSITREAGEINYKNAGNRLYKGLDMPAKGQEAEFMNKTFDSWLPVIHQYAQEKGAKINTLDDLRNFADKTTNEHYQDHYLPLVKPFLNEQVSVNPIHEALDKVLLDNHKLMIENPGLKDRLMKKVEPFQNATMSMGDLLKARESYNKATRKLTKGIQTNQDLKTSATQDADLAINKAMRDVLDRAVESHYPNNLDVKEILRNQRDLYTMRDHIEDASQTWDAEKRSRAGERLGLLAPMTRAASRSSTRGGTHSILGSAISKAYESFNNPDSLVKSSFKLLDRVTPSYQLPVIGQTPGAMGPPLAGRGPAGTAPPSTGMTTQQQGGGMQTVPPSKVLRLKGRSLPEIPQRVQSDEEFF